MFTSFSRFRREVAVLAVLSLVASVLVVAAPAAAADPKADFTATFDACAGTGEAGFTDVPEGHANAGDIDCIAYYGITKGTSATTYSPLMSVSREHMALFLTRLAGLVGIAVSSTPSDPGFTDDDELSAESQTAIAQLADLGITQGTSATTFSPAANVKRGHMALFIQRLMNKMTAVSDGDDSDGDWGYTPSDVVDNDQKKTIGSPFTDLGSATKNEYDAITQLWELGVASGISDTSYAPASDITRAAMAGFMASLLDHSNARPAGVTMQGTETEGFGPLDGTVMVSYRSDSFAPMASMAIDIFSSIAAGGSLNKDGTCVTSGASNVAAQPVEGGTVCERDDNDPVTGESGNIFFTDDTGGGTETNVPEVTRVYTAWTGDVGDKFDADDVDEATLSILSKKDVASIKVTSDINENANATAYVATAETNPPANDAVNGSTGSKVDLDTTSSVMFTVQLKDAAESAGGDVAKADVDISVTVAMVGKTTSNNTYTVKTDSDGKATYTVNAPSQGGDDSDDRRQDTLIFSYADGAEDDETMTILWLDDDPARTSAKVTSSSFTVRSGDKAKVSGTVTIYDQYGDIFKKSGQKVTITIGSATAQTRNAASGRASLSGDDTTSAGSSVAVSATILDSSVVPTPANTMIVTRASSSSSGGQVTALFAKEDAFHVSGVLYSYDSDDSFYFEGNSVTLDEFEVLLGRDITTVNTAANVSAVLYNDEGSSIFSVTRRASA